MPKKNKITIQAKVMLILIFILVGIFLLLVSLFCTTCIVQNNNHNKLIGSLPLVDNNKNQAQEIDTVVVDNNYRQKTIEIVKKYLTQDANLATNDYTAKMKNVKETVDAIMGLTLTSAYKDVHLSLVLALDDAQRGYEAYATGKKIEGQRLLLQSAEKMDEVMQAHAWLKTE